MIKFFKSFLTKKKDNKQDEKKQDIISCVAKNGINLCGKTTRKICTFFGIKTKSKFQQVYEKIENKVVDEVNDIKYKIGLPSSKTRMQRVAEQSRNVVLSINNKILYLTDKIVVIYDKCVAGRFSVIWNWCKDIAKKLFLLIKNGWLFVVEFYKKDKKRAIIYFILLYVFYKIFSSIAWRISNAFQSHKNDMIVSVRKVEAERIEKNVNCYGYLESENNLQYVSEVRGNIEKILVKEKQHVKEGQLLMILDSKFTANAYTSAKSILESKKFQYNAIHKLYEDGLESKGNLKAMEADLENANSNFESAKKAFNGLTIYAPFDGYIDNINNKEGSQINPGTKLFTLERMNAMQVKCDVQNISTDEVKVGDKVKIFIGGHEMANGTIAVIGDSIDVYTGNRTILVNKVLANDGFDGKIKPGMSVMMKISAKANENTYKVSSEALETTETGAFMVKVLNPKSGEIFAKNIWIYDERDGVDYVIGLADGDYVVERGHEFVAIGEKGIKYAEVASKQQEDSKINIKKTIFQIGKTIKNSVEAVGEFITDLPDFYDWIVKKYSSKITNTKTMLLDCKNEIMGFITNKFGSK